MQTATTEQVPAAAQAAETQPAAPVSGGVDNVTGAELVAAFKQRRIARAQAASAPAQPPGESKPAGPETTAPPVAAAPEPASGPESQAASPSDGETSPESEATTETTETTETADTTDATQAPPEENTGIAAMQARIDRLTARLREAERSLEDQKAESSQPKPDSRLTDHASRSTGEFGHDQEVQSLTQEIARQQRILQWVARNPEGGEVPGKDGLIAISAEDAFNARITAEDQLAELRAQRATRVNALRTHARQMAEQAAQHVSQTFAWAKDEKSQEMQALRTIESLVPDIGKVWPAWQRVVAHGIDALVKAQAKSGTNGTATAKPAAKPPRVAPVAGSTAPRVNPQQKALAEAEAAYEKNPTGQNFQRVTKLRREARLSPA